MKKKSMYGCVWRRINEKELKDVDIQSVLSSFYTNKNETLESKERVWACVMIVHKWEQRVSEWVCLWMMKQREAGREWWRVR